MANKKSAYKKAEPKVVVAESVAETVIAEDAKIVEKESVTEKSVEYEIVLAAPTYYIINKNGHNTTINGINNYKKGDIV